MAVLAPAIASDMPRIAEIIGGKFRMNPISASPLFWGVLEYDGRDCSISSAFNAFRPFRVRAVVLFLVLVTGGALRLGDKYRGGSRKQVLVWMCI